MLSKLIKHELRATGRTMLPLLGMLPVLAILAGISVLVFFFAHKTPSDPGLSDAAVAISHALTAVRHILRQ